MKIVAIGAHFDDVECGVGGTLAKYIKQGAAVHVIVMTPSGYERYDGTNGRTEKAARYEGLNALRMLGLKLPEPYLTLLNFPTKLVPNDPAAIEAVEKVLVEEAPDLIFTHFVNDNHAAHANTARVTLAAARDFGSVLQYEPFIGRNMWGFYGSVYSIFDGDCMHKKGSAMRAHTTENNKYGEAWIESTVARARMHGCEYSKEEKMFGEVFMPTKLDLEWSQT